jgi:hypothetical protein
MEWPPSALLSGEHDPPVHPCAQIRCPGPPRIITDELGLMCFRTDRIGTALVNHHFYRRQYIKFDRELLLIRQLVLDRPTMVWSISAS